MTSRDAQGQEREAPRTDERVRWMNNDARYKAPEQVYETLKNHVQLMVDHAADLERELAEAKAERERDAHAYRGALGYAVPGDHDGRLCDGSTPSNGLARAVAQQRDSALTETVELRERVTEWVSVEDRLPEIGSRVIVTWVNFEGERRVGERVRLIPYEGALSEFFWQYWNCSHGLLLQEAVTHWQPLPAPPALAPKVGGAE